MTDHSISSADATLPAAPPPKKTSRWEDFIDIFYAPADVFARRATSGFGIPLLVVSLLVGVIFLASSSAMQPIMDGEFSRSMAAAQKKNPQLTAEQMQGFRSVGEKFAKVAAFVIMPIIIFLTGLFLWVVGKFFGAKQTLGAALMVSAYANVIKILASIAGAIQLLLLDSSQMTSQYHLSLGVARFLDVDATSPMLVALLGRVDVFTIWVTILLGIGLSVTGKIPRSQAMIAAVVVWFIGAVPALLGAARQ